MKKLMKYNQIYLFALLALLFMACSGDDEKVSESDAITFLSLAGSFSGSSELGQWQSGDRIGVYMFESGTTTPLSNASNVIYTAGSTGAITTFSSITPLQFSGNESLVSFAAYYPYSSAVSNLLYPISLADQTEGTRKHELMTATTAQGEVTSARVSMNFRHQLTKVVFRFVDKNGTALFPTTLTIEGMNTTANFNIATNEIRNASGITTITAYKPANGDYEAILLPVTVDANTHWVNYTMDGNNFEWNMTHVQGGLTALQPGYKYTFTLNQDDLTAPAKVVIEHGSVTPWGNQNYEDAGSADLITNYTVFPANGATGTFKDTYLKLIFKEQAPEVGTTGTIRVYKASDNTLVDEIDMADAQPRFTSGGTLNSKMDILGKTGNNGGRHRVVNYNPLTIEGNTAIIKLHYDCLDYNTKYYVVIDKGVINHADFNGISGSSKWTFTTKAEPAVPTDDAHTVTVGGDHTTADFRTIQAAIDFLASKVPNTDQKTVYVQNGRYEELLFMRGVNKLTIKGESRDGVIIRYTNNDGINGGVGGSCAISDRTKGVTIAAGGGRAVMLAERVDKFRMENLTLESTHADNKGNGQAEAIYVNNDTNQGIIFVNCNVLSYQDTLNLKGFAWFYQCLVAGDVDFIWGSPIAALFEKCEIRSRGNGYIVQARVAENNKGFVFLNCDLTTTGAAMQMYLCRTAGNASYFDNITFANCKMADIYGTYGWGYSSGGSGTAPNPAPGTLANGYKIYNCTNLDGGTIAINNAHLAYTLTESEFLDGFSTPTVVLAGYTDVDWFQ
jgi:pectin methylesterase-like acyl-CoA thioesterase